MRVAICCAGSSLLDHLPFSRSGFDVVVAVNDAANHVQWDHWAAGDSHMPDFQKKFPDWQAVDWGMKVLKSGTVHFRQWRKYTFPLALERVQLIYDPDEIHVFGADFCGARLDGVTCKEGRWEREAEHIRSLDLSKVTWHGKFKG